MSEDEEVWRVEREGCESERNKPPNVVGVNETILHINGERNLQMKKHRQMIWPVSKRRPTSMTISDNWKKRNNKGHLQPPTNPKQKQKEDDTNEGRPHST